MPHERLKFAAVEPAVFGNSPVSLTKAKKGTTLWTAGDFSGDLRGIKGLESPNGVHLLTTIRVIKGEKIVGRPEERVPDKYELAVFVDGKPPRLVIGSHLIFDSPDDLADVYEGLTGFVGTHRFKIKRIPIVETLGKIEEVMNPPLPGANFVSREWVFADEITGTAVALVKWQEPDEADIWAYVVAGNAYGSIFSTPFVPSPDFEVEQLLEDDFEVSLLCHGQIKVFGTNFWREANGFRSRKSAFTPYPVDGEAEAV